MSNLQATNWSKIHVMALARAFSMLGTELTLFSLVFREKDNGPTAVAAVFIAGVLPALLLSPVAGTIADRFSTRAIIPAFSVLASIAIALQVIQTSTWMSVILLFVSSACSTVVPLAWGKVTRSLTIEEDFSRASGVVQSYFALAMLSGPFLAGWLVSATGFTVTFLIDAALTLAIAVMPFVLRVNFKPEKLQAGERMKMTGGFAHLFNNNFLRNITILVFAMVLCISVVSVGDVFLLTEQMNADAFIYGVVGAAFALGTLLGSLLAGRIKVSPKTELNLLGLGLLVLAGSAVAVGVSPNYWFVMAIWCIAGFGNAAINSYGVGMMMRAIPMELQGRTFAAFSGITSVAGIGSQAVTGVILAFIDVRTLFIWAGSLALLSVLLLFPSVYRAQRGEQAVEAEMQAAQ